MRAVATDRVAWSVCVSVCLSVRQIHEPCNAIWGSDLGGPRNRVLHEARSPEERAIFGDCLAH